MSESIKTKIKNGTIKKVGVVYPPAKSPLSYRRVEKDKDGWADADKFLPEDFDLVQMKTSTGKIFVGWLVGNGWDGLKIKPTDVVVKWRKTHEPT